MLGNKAAFGNSSSVAWNGVSTSANTDLSGANAIANTSTIGGNTVTFTGANNIELSGSVTSTASAATRVITNNMSNATLTMSGNVYLSSDNTTAGRGLTFSGTGKTLVSGPIANNSGANTLAASLVKSGLGTLTASGPNTYTGTTTVSGGMLQFSKQVSLYNGNTGSWTASNITVSSGATAAFNVGGTGEFNSSNIDTLKILGAASNGFTSGSFLALDTTNAGGSFAYSSSIANPNGGANVLGLTKLGTGSLVLTGASTYSGTTTISAGTLQLGNGTGGNDGTISNSLSIVNNANLTYNRAGSVSYGGVISGSGTVTKLGTGTQTLTGNNSFAGTTTISAGTSKPGQPARSAVAPPAPAESRSTAAALCFSAITPRPITLRTPQPSFSPRAARSIAVASAKGFGRLMQAHLDRLRSAWAPSLSRAPLAHL